MVWPLLPLTEGGGARDGGGREGGGGEGGGGEGGGEREVTGVGCESRYVLESWGVRAST